MDTQGSHTTIMEPFAIVGLSFKLPQDVTDDLGFWRVLQERSNLSTEWPEGRLPPDSLYRKEFSARGGHFFKEDPALFDAPFFSITPREAAAMDPQQRLALEASFHAFENAGIPIESLRGSQTAVFGGTMSDDYSRIISKDFDTAPPQGLTGIQPSILPNRISWYFDLRGPSVHIDTACSSSMFAVDMACQALRSGNATTALVLGSNVLLSPEPSVLLGKGKFLSPDSKCFSFDARANGYARGEGIIALVIKPLRKALRDGDVIRAVIRGTGSNQDGRTPTLTQPSSDSQGSLIRQVYSQAGLTLDRTRYFEAHGTGTPIGDPVEMTAIGGVFREYRTPEDPLFVGSVKSNIGHLEGASGGAGIIKAILALENGVIPPNALFESMNPDIDAAFYNVQVPVKNVPWPTCGIRRVSVNSFGYGGTNSHIILDDAFHYLRDQNLAGYHHCITDTTIENAFTVNGATFSTSSEYDIKDATKPMDPNHPPVPTLLIWSAADSSAIRRMTQAYQEYYQAHIAGNVFKTEQLAYTLAARRSIMSWRTFAVVGEQDTSIEISKGSSYLRSLSLSQPIRASIENHSIALIFSGQGMQYVKMGLELLRYPVFEESIQRSDDVLHCLGCGWSVQNELNNDSIKYPEFSQPLCTVLQIALVDLLRSFELTPTAVVGHSSGEIAAAYAVGALSRASALKVAYFRGKLAEKLRTEGSPPGDMMSVNLSEAEVPTYLGRLGLAKDALYVACVNSPANVTLSGPSHYIDILYQDLDKHGIFARKLNTGVAYHSPAMRAVTVEYLLLMGSLEADMTRCHDHSISMISSVTGLVTSPKMLSTPEYWIENFVAPVRFLEAMQVLVSNKFDSILRPGTGTITDLVEIGPHSSLRRPVRDSAPAELRYHSVLERTKSPLQTVLILLGKLFCYGHSVSIRAGNRQTQDNLPFLVDCPPYPFDHSRRYWYESRLSKDFTARPEPHGYLLGRRAHDWNVLRPRWRNWLNTETMPWLKDHVVSGTNICPGTGMLAMAIEAVSEMVASNNNVVSGFLVKDAEFLAPILIGETIQTSTETVLHLNPILNAYEKDSTLYEILIFSYREERWTESFRANVQVQYEQTAITPIDGGKENQLTHEQVLACCVEAFSTCTESLGRRAFYHHCDENGIHYGESFKLLRDIAWDGHNASTAQIDVVSTEGQRITVDSPVHPAILDAAIHLVLVQKSQGLTKHIPTFIPQRLTNLWISAKTWNQEASLLRLTSILQPGVGSSTGLRCSVNVLADDGIPLYILEDLTMTEITRPNESDTNRGDRTLLHNIAWKPQLSSLCAEELIQLCNSVAQTFDETFEERWGPKAERSLQMVVRKTLRSLVQGNLDNAPAYMRQYLSSLEHLYASPAQDEIEEIHGSAVQTLMDECEADNPDCGVFFQIGRALPAILSGETNPLELMFATKSAETLYTYLANQQMRDGRFNAFLDLASHEKPSLKILEVGAGTGSMARHVLGALQRLEKETGQCRFASYTYTDISPAFFETAKTQFEDFQGRLLFKTLDLERSPDQQGFELGSYDLIVGGLVLHATSNLATTLRRLHDLLVPGGYIAFHEVVNTNSAFANVTFGSLEGWWLSTEDWRQYTPLLTEEKWGELLLETGFSGADLVLRDYKSELCHLCSLIISKSIRAAPAGGKLDSVGDQHGSNLVLLLNPDIDIQRALASKICEQYPVARALGVADIRDGKWDILADDIVVSLLELGVPHLSALSEFDFQSLKKMVQSSQNMLWVGSLPTINGKMVDPHASIATGFLRGIRSEEPSKRIVTLTFESDDPYLEPNLVTKVLSTCFSREAASQELEFVVRQGCLNIGRLKREIQLDTECLSLVEPQLRTERWGSGPSLVLEVGTPGMLDTLRFVEDPVYQSDLVPGEVEIEAVAWPISFRDIFVALGRLGMEGLGVECAGTVTRIGQGCPYDICTGDRVVLVHIGCMRSHPRAMADMVVKIPDGLSFYEAVAAINPGVTAYYSLLDVARLQPGEKVLIHSGAGSTGQMAIAIAKRLGAEIFSTVGSEDKKRLLMDRFTIPDDHIFYSRNTSFAKGIKRVTNGYGVDVILNSLSGEGLRASWECIAPYGRFIEIGKADIGSNSFLPMASFANNVTFAAVDLHHISQTNNKLMRRLLEKVMGLIAQRKVCGPMPVHLYPISRVEKAFRHIQGGTNTGRIIMTASHEDSVLNFLVKKSTWKFDANASYVVVGGFGGIGRAILRWMVEKGAKNIIVPSRSGPSSQPALAVVSSLTNQGVCVITSRCNVASATELSTLVRDCAAKMPPIKGCINAAMVLQDSIFENMTHIQWSRTIQSKVNASWNLHQLLPGDMDFFILLSSVAGIYGSPGQSNYAAGCTFQDALARSRASAGYRGSVSFNLGWMRTIGIIAETEEYHRNREHASDMAKVEESDLLSLLDHYCDPSLHPLTAEQSQVLVGALTPADFHILGKPPIPVLSRPLFAGFNAPELYKNGRVTDSASSQEDPSTLFRKADTLHARSAVVVSALRAKLARALEIKAEEVDPRRSLSDYSTDSLMAVELRNWMRRDFGVTVAVFDIMQGRNIEAVGELVAGRAES